MSLNWENDKRWSDRFLPEIKGILGLHLIGEPPLEEDAQHNTDLIVLRMEAVRIGCRVRRFNAYNHPDYRDEFTIREGRPSGAKTEMTKIIEGWGDYFFYGFADDAEANLEKWTLADLRVFRVAFMRHIVMNDGDLPGQRMSNHDNSSWFRAFRWEDLPADLVVATFDRNDDVPF